MKAKLDVNEVVIKNALFEYFEKRNLKPNKDNIVLKGEAAHDAMDRRTGGSYVSAVVEIDVGEIVAA